MNALRKNSVARARAIAVVLATVALLNGCTVIDKSTAPPADWPRLQVTETLVGTLDMIVRCYKHLPLGMMLLGGIPLACAEIDLNAGTCTIWYASITPTQSLDHEREHCDGHDHVGESTLRDFFARWKRREGK